MKKAKAKAAPNQAARFIEAARAAECSEDEAVFDETMKKIAKAKPKGSAHQRGSK
jgi:uncharacterized protein HemY